jgi:PIN domain nuclease of toxin-antitoxin system
MTTDMQPLLLDTHAAIWISLNEQLTRRAEEALNAVHKAAGVVFVSPITAWEVGLLVSRNRLNLLMTPQRWFARLLNVQGMRLADLSPDILIASSFLPGTPPRDPADRIILATARDLGATLITRDRLLLKYGEDGQVSTIAC